MLTIRKPIELRTQKPIQGLREDMAERMQANYGLMNMSIRKEELLHVTSEPPEVYFAEGDNFQIFNNIKNNNQQEIRLDVINNLINRIMVSQTENFTYQDTVYISSVLRRLGIRDEKLFMKQVFALQNEHKETRQLLENYENHQDILKKFFLQQQEMKKTEQRNEETVRERERRYYIHDEIFQRLETGKIYQDMHQFSKGNRHESQQIFRTEMQLGEQATLEQNFLLQELKQNITNAPAPLYYCHNNQYEYLQEITENIEEQIEEQMSAAILLNIVDQSYALRQEQIEENSHYWYSIAGALFQTAENTWRRYETNLLERKFVTDHVLEVLDEVNQMKHLENTTIQNISSEYAKMEEVWNTALQTNNFTAQQYVQTNHSNEEIISGGSYHLTDEELKLEFLNQTQEVENEETSITVEQLQKQLEVFNQQNYENYLKMQEIAKTQPQLRDRKLDRKKAQRDALRALENPEEVLKEYLTTEVKDSVVEKQREVETQIYHLFSDETKEIYRQFLLQNQTTEETFLQHIMNQPEENMVREEVLQSLKQVESQVVLKQGEVERNENVQYVHPVTIDITNEEKNQLLQKLHTEQILKTQENWVNPKEVIRQMNEEETLLTETIQKQLETIQYHREHILNASNTNMSQETIRRLKEMTFVYPKEITDTEGRVWEEEYRILLKQIERESGTTELKTEIKKFLEYTEKQKALHQIRKIAETNTEYLQPVVFEIMNQKIKQQMQVYEQLQTTEIYEKWMMPADVVWQIEQAESELVEESILRQKHVEKQWKHQQVERQVLLNQVKTEEIFQTIDFVHKVEEQLLNEELLEEIRMQREHTKKQEFTEQSTLENKTMHYQTVQETVNHMQTTQLNQIEELVQQSVKRQIGDLSEQVYGKIEKKLQTERKRRGYF